MIGKCHTCPRVGGIAFCPKCDHWFCGHCRKLSITRVKAFLDEVLNGRRSGCCGPSVEVEAGLERGERVGSSPNAPLAASVQPRLEQKVTL